MSRVARPTVELPFSDKYDQTHSLAYLRKHQDGLARRLSNWRDMRIARKALRVAGEPGVILDLPCGAGRFWPLLVENADRVVIGADNSAAMLKIARSMQPPAVVERVQTLHTSAFDIDLPSETVDCVFCMRLLHHVGESAHRMTMLRQFHRVTRDTVILSLWVDGNFKAWRRRRLERTRVDGRGYQNRFVLPAAQAEREFSESGLEVIARLDFLPRYAMWRTYVLRKRTA